MWWQRPNWLIILALLATLTPASFVAAATRIIDLSFRAINPGPVNPLRGSFRFECSGVSYGSQLCSDPHFGGNLGGSTDLHGGGTGLPPTFVRVNYGSFTKANVLGAFELDNGAVLKYRVEGKVSQLGVFLDECCVPPGLVPAGDNFQLVSNLGPPFKPGVVIYKTSSSSSPLQGWQNNEGGLIVRTETRISGS